jgi:hypothetical protein
MTNRLKLSFFSIIIHLMLFIITLPVELAAQSSESTPPPRKYYAGFNASFGSRTFKCESDFSGINRNSVGLAGGQVGVTLGSTVFRLNIGAFGYYSSVSNIAGTIDLYETNATLNFNPLSLIRGKGSRIEPYIIAGMNYDRLLLYGFYDGTDAPAKNHSLTQQPYLGTLKQLSTTIGTGIEIKIMDRYDFVHLFSEMRYGHVFRNSANRTELNNTNINDHLMLNIGIRFGQIGDMPGKEY